MFYQLASYTYWIPKSLHFDLNDWRGWAGIIMLVVFVSWTIWSDFFVFKNKSDDQDTMK